MNGNPNTVAERLVDGKGRAMLTYSLRRPASAAPVLRTSSGVATGDGDGTKKLAKRPTSAAPRQVSTDLSGTDVCSRPASARAGARSASGGRKSEMGGLVNRTWELAMEQQSGGRAGRPARSSGALLALGKGGNAMADTHSLLDSFVQDPTAASSASQKASAQLDPSSAVDRMGHRGTYRRPSSAAAGAGASRSTRGPVELDSSLMSRSAFSLSADDHASSSSLGSAAAATMAMTSAAAERARRHQQRSRRQKTRRPSSAGSLRAAVGSWGETRGRGVGLTQLTRGRSFARGQGSTHRSAWGWEDNLSALQQQSKRYAGAEITLN